MAPGPHIISLVAANGDRSSEQSVGLSVTFRSPTADGGDVIGMSRRSDSTIDHVIGTLADVRAIAALPDGSLLVGESRGRVLRVGSERAPRVALDLRRVSRDPVTLLAIAAAPDYARSGAVFLTYSTGQESRLVRLTDANGQLGNHAVLRDNLPLAASTSVSMAIGSDGRIYIAGPHRVLMFNRDGSIPADAPPSGSFSTAMALPLALVAERERRVLWLLGAGDDSTSQLWEIAIAADGAGRIVKSYDLSDSNGAGLAVTESRERERLVLAAPSTAIHMWNVQSDGSLEPAATLTVGIERIIAIDRAGPSSLWVATPSSVYRFPLPQ